jgi:DNA gyrase/topoisomerase IV subunit B
VVRPQRGLGVLAGVVGRASTSIVPVDYAGGDASRPDRLCDNLRDVDEQDYSADSIEVLSSQQAIRRRPAMWLGVALDAPDVLGLLVESALCWALDEAADGAAREVRVTLFADASIGVADDGPGMPVELDPATSRPLAERYMTVLSACRAAKRNPKIGEKHCLLGMVVVNALSAWCELEIQRGGQRWRQRYEAGVPVTALEQIGVSAATGTEIRFRPDPSLFGARPLDVDDLIGRLRAAADSVPGTRIVLLDARDAANPLVLLELA